MKKVISVLLATAFAALCLCVPAFATSTTKATEKIDASASCSLSITYAKGDIKFSDKDVSIYKVANVTEDIVYTVLEPFSSEPIDLTSIKDNSEYGKLANTFYGFVNKNKVVPTASAKTDSNGNVKFSVLSVGLYLVTPLTKQVDDTIYSFNPLLVAVPDVNNEGKWVYDISVNPKSMLPDQKQRKVVVNWDDAGNENSRPKEIVVDIFKDGEVYETVTLNEDNNWSFDWFNDDPDANWSVAPKTKNDKYNFTVDLKGNVFTVNAKFVQSPKTGDFGIQYLFGLAAIAFLASVAVYRKIEE